MLAKGSNDFLTPIGKDCCRSISCVGECLSCISAKKHYVLSCSRSLTRPRIALDSCAWQKTLTAFLTRLRSAAETLSVIERQRIVRLLVKEVLVGEDTITIRHSIPIPSGPSQNGGSQPEGPNYLLCKGRGIAVAGEHLLTFRLGACPSIQL